MRSITQQVLNRLYHGMVIRAGGTSGLRSHNMEYYVCLCCHMHV